MKKILISACMLGDNVRYDGGHHLINHPTLQRWRKEGRLVAVCPEVAGGMTIPRPAAEPNANSPFLSQLRKEQTSRLNFLMVQKKPSISLNARA